MRRSLLVLAFGLFACGGPQAPADSPSSSSSATPKPAASARAADAPPSASAPAETLPPVVGHFSILERIVSEKGGHWTVPLELVLDAPPAQSNVNVRFSFEKHAATAATDAFRTRVSFFEAGQPSTHARITLDLDRGAKFYEPGEYVVSASVEDGRLAPAQPVTLR